jgi:hypothetical protein
MSTKTYKTKKNFKIFEFFFLYSVEGARCGSRQKFNADQRIFKYCKQIGKNAPLYTVALLLKG